MAFNTSPSCLAPSFTVSPAAEPSAVPGCADITEVDNNLCTFCYVRSRPYPSIITVKTTDQNATNQIYSFSCLPAPQPRPAQCSCSSYISICCRGFRIPILKSLSPENYSISENIFMLEREGLLGYRLNFEQNGIYIGTEE